MGEVVKYLGPPLFLGLQLGQRRWRRKEILTTQGEASVLGARVLDQTLESFALELLHYFFTVESGVPIWSAFLAGLTQCFKSRRVCVETYRVDTSTGAVATLIGRPFNFTLLVKAIEQEGSSS